jgi:hypothetical protein
MHISVRRAVRDAAAAAVHCVVALNKRRAAGSGWPCCCLTAELLQFVLGLTSVDRTQHAQLYGVSPGRAKQGMHESNEQGISLQAAASSCRGQTAKTSIVGLHRHDALQHPFCIT